MPPPLVIPASSVVPSFKISSMPGGDNSLLSQPMHSVLMGGPGDCCESFAGNYPNPAWEEDLSTCSPQPFNINSFQLQLDVTWQGTSIPVVYKTAWLAGYRLRDVCVSIVPLYQNNPGRPLTIKYRVRYYNPLTQGLDWSNELEAPLT
jgi:hypothetical protein